MLTYLHLLVEFFVYRTGFQNRQAGATLIEYALIISAIAVAVLGASLALTGNLTAFFNALGGGLDTTNAGSAG